MSDLSTDIAIELINVNKNFQDFIAVNNVNLQIRQGEFFSMLGPSGCGKTTTLRMIAGLETPSSGKILLEGKNVTSIPAYRRNVNTVFSQLTILNGESFGGEVRFAGYPHYCIKIDPKMIDFLNSNALIGTSHNWAVANSDIREELSPLSDILNVKKVII